MRTAHFAAMTLRSGNSAARREVGVGLLETLELGPSSPGLGGMEGPGATDCAPGADDVLVQAALTALALRPQAREALLQGVQV